MGHSGTVVTHLPPISEVIDKLYALVSSAHKTTHHDMTYTVLKATLNPK